MQVCNKNIRYLPPHYFLAQILFLQTRILCPFVGHYVPQLAELIYDRNKNRHKHPYINLKGFIVCQFPTLTVLT